MAEATEQLGRSDRMRLRVSSWLCLASGAVHSVDRRYGEAEQKYREALQRHPESDMAHLMLGARL